MGTLQVHLLGLISLLIVSVLYYAGVDVVKTLSPQGCRMSWMSPSYILQTGLDHSWSPLAGRYNLWLYREVGWEGNELNGLPVIFIPGNAGSSHQVRSIASSATRQYFAAPYDISYEFRGRHMKPLDFFTVEFNEDLSAFHGSTLDAQTSYTSQAIDYILSLYPSGTGIVVLGHSMGGVVATSLLPHANISSIITMSTPHTLPPARFDRRIDRIYDHNRQSLLSDMTPILSLCGGATDLMIPSEYCILPPPAVGGDGDRPYRRTVFTSALEGSWTGVGHREMVWCHQVRWRVARAALELGGTSSLRDRGITLDTWLRDGYTLPPGYDGASAGHLDLRAGEFTILPADTHLTIKNPAGSHTYLLHIPSEPANRSAGIRKFILYVSQGSVVPTSPRNPLPLRASVFVCLHGGSCTPLQPNTLKLVPNTSPGQPFPVPDEGSDESEGVVVFEADVAVDEDTRVAIKMEDGDGRGWIVGGFVQPEPITLNVNPIVPLLSHISVALDSASSLKTSVYIPRLLSNALVVHRLTPRFTSSCTEPLLSPLLQHTSHPSETHYYPLTLSRRILLHTHASGPYISSSYTHGLNLTIYSSGEGACSVKSVDIAIDWWATLGRWGVRYAAPAVSWAVGIVAFVLFDASRTAEICGSVPKVPDALFAFARTRLLKSMVASYAISFIPLPSWLWLGNQGEPWLAPMAPLMLLTSTGLVCVSWWLINILKWPLSFISSNTKRTLTTPARRKNALLSLGLICSSIFLFIPWQVGFLGCWIFHLYTCASHKATTSTIKEEPTAIPLIFVSEPESDDAAEPREIRPSPSPPPAVADQAVQSLSQNVDINNENEHLLLLMTWLLPLTAPILAVWVRTLFTAGFTTPFDGDHNFLLVLPFIILVDPGWAYTWLTSNGGRLLTKARWRMLVLALTAFVLGPRASYAVFITASGVLGLGLLLSLVEGR